MGHRILEQGRLSTPKLHLDKLTRPFSPRTEDQFVRKGSWFDGTRRSLYRLKTASKGEGFCFFPSRPTTKTVLQSLLPFTFIVYRYFTSKSGRVVIPKLNVSRGAGGDERSVDVVPKDPDSRRTWDREITPQEETREGERPFTDTCPFHINRPTL